LGLEEVECHNRSCCDTLTRLEWPGGIVDSAKHYIRSGCIGLKAEPRDQTGYIAGPKVPFERFLDDQVRPVLDRCADASENELWGIGKPSKDTWVPVEPPLVGSGRKLAGHGLKPARQTLLRSRPFHWRHVQLFAASEG